MNTRVGVVDLGTNTTRLLVADVSDAGLVELDRRTAITGLGRGVDATGRLADDSMDRVRETLATYGEALDALEVRRVVAVATSAMRDARNGPAFRDELNARFGIDAHTISGDEEARLTFLGATTARAGATGDQVVVVDIGGGSTEFVEGVPGRDPSFHVSTQLGSVRHTERFLEADPPTPTALAALAAEVRATIERSVPASTRGAAARGIAVAGTPTSLAAIDQTLYPYDSARVHGYRLTLAAAERITAALAAQPLPERRAVTGLHPERAPTIVAGATILVESMRAFGLDAIEVSEADILYGAALTVAAT